AVARARGGLASAIEKLPTYDADLVEAGAGQLTTLLVQTTSAALLLGQAVGDARKALVAVRYVRRHLGPRDLWEDRIAADTGRQPLAYDEVDEERAAKAA